MAIPAWNIRVAPEDTVTRLYVVPSQNLDVAGKIYQMIPPCGIGIHAHLVSLYRFCASVVFGLTYNDLVKALNAIALFPEYVEACCDSFMRESQADLSAMHKKVPDISGVHDAPPFNVGAVSDIIFSRRARLPNWAVNIHTRELEDFDNYPNVFSKIKSVINVQAGVPDANLKNAFIVLATTVMGLNKTEFDDYEKTILYLSTFPDYFRLCLETCEYYPQLLHGVHLSRHVALEDYNTKPQRRKRMYESRVQGNLILEYFVDRDLIKLSYGFVRIPTREDVLQSMSAKLEEEIKPKAKPKLSKPKTTKKHVAQPKRVESPPPAEPSRTPTPTPTPTPIGEPEVQIYAQDPYVTDSRADMKQFIKMYHEDLAIVERYITDGIPLTYYMRMWFYHYHHQYMEKLDGDLFRAGAQIEPEVLIRACQMGRYDAARGRNSHPTSKPFVLPKLHCWPCLEDMCDLYGGITRLHLRSDLVEFLNRKFALTRVIFDRDDKFPVILECEPFYRDFLIEMIEGWPYVRVAHIGEL